MSMRVCYLDCHEAGLCCYLVIHIETLLRPLQLFHFHLTPLHVATYPQHRHPQRLTVCGTACGDVE
jgi:hypothetical protein